MDKIDPYAVSVIEAFDGPTKLARLIDAPTSTVFSWRKIGIPPSRLAHIKLVAQMHGVDLPREAA